MHHIRSSVNRKNQLCWKISFREEKYVEYNDLLKNVAVRCGFGDLSQVDHFMNYVYWKYVKVWRILRP